ncbi:hypothetical protein GTG28_20825 [Vibrio sp. OCN044]|uniref:Uncharacterized protein n=1 Tax=Vibrio tetraodonis subsp. pristinus TaxID=2695891 RepID=A0A6L8M5M4_9VIBR|nr:hypothetical protein [Vibrio tetraodonis]MYM61649.1 hypothetical protein [Vibrio tetraodonis subsp. pristinus]
MSKSKHDDKFLFNVTDLTRCFDKSPNTVRNAIKDNNVKHVKSKGNTKFYALADVAPFLVPNRAKARGRNTSIESTERNRAQEIISVYGSFKEYKEYMTGEKSRLGLEEIQGVTIRGDKVSICISRVIGSIQSYFKRLPNRCEEVCVDWLPKHSAKLDDELSSTFEKIIDELRQYAHDADNE